MDIAEKKILVTGAGGFIGSHLVEALVAAGANVTAMIHYNSGSHFGNLELIDPAIFHAVHVIAGDVRDAFFMLRATEKMDAIFHLAALIPIPYSYVAPQSFFDTNVQGTLNVLEAVRWHQIPRVIVTSTSETYGSARYTPIDEDHPLQGQSPYAASKIAADKLAESYFLSFQTPVVTLRPFNTFGPRQSARAVIPTIISQALTTGVIKIGSLTPVRDFLYVADTAAAFMSALKAEAAVGEVVHVGTGVGITIGELQKEIEQLLGKNCSVVEDETRLRPEASEVKELVCDATKAKTLLGWQPRHTRTAGLKETIQFVESHLSLYKTDRYIL